MSNAHPNPFPDWLADKSWKELVYASELPSLADLAFPLSEEWKKIYDSPDPHTMFFPEPWNYLTGIGRLVVLRCLRPDKIVPAMQGYVEENLGQYFIEPPTFDIQACLSDSTNITPLIFILSPGADPMATILKLASENGFTGLKAPKTISLGQGQGPLAENLILAGLKFGSWVVLQNCHLATSWMPTLEKLCEEVITPVAVDPNFRLWLTSYASPTFPVSVLQNGIKMTNEPPQGLRANLLRSYLNDPISNPEFYDGCKKSTSWHRLLYSLCFFHANVQERRKFGALGWNIPYEFNDSDLHISMRQIKMFLDDYEVTPYDALQYLIGECNYGGRVTDDHDRRLLNSILFNYINSDVTNVPLHKFLEDGDYYVPDLEAHKSFVEYIRLYLLVIFLNRFSSEKNACDLRDIFWQKMSRRSHVFLPLILPKL